MIKRMVHTSAALFLFGCQSNDMEDTTPEKAEVDEVVEEVDASHPVTEEETINEEHPLKNLIKEGTFVDDYALQAWEDYKKVVTGVTYGEVTLINQENADLKEIEGTSSSELEDRFTSIELRNDVFKDTGEKSESEILHFYRYPAEKGSDYNEVSDFLAELSFYFADDNLMFSSITSGLYSLELNDLPEAAALTTFLTVAEIEAIDSQVFTIAEMSINGNLIRQIMIPATNVNEEGTQEILAVYFFIHGEAIIQYAYLAFEMVMQSLPDYSLLLYQQLIPALEGIDL